MKQSTTKPYQWLSVRLLTLLTHWRYCNLALNHRYVHFTGHTVAAFDVKVCHCSTIIPHACLGVSKLRTIRLIVQQLVQVNIKHIIKAQCYRPFVRVIHKDLLIAHWTVRSKLWWNLNQIRIENKNTKYAYFHKMHSYMASAKLSFFIQTLMCLRIEAVWRTY